MRLVLLVATSVALAGAVGASPARADSFDWLGKIAADADGLKDESVRQRVKAVTRLGTYSIAWSKPYLLGALSDPSSQVRHAAGRILAASGVAEIVPELSSWLSSPDPAHKVAAAEMLGELKSKAAVGSLVRALGEPDKEVRVRAVRALGEIPDPSVVVPLIGRLEDPEGPVRGAAVTALSKVGDRRAVVPLVGVFSDTEPGIAQQAIEAVGRLGDKSALPALIRLLRDPQLRTAAASALGNLGAESATRELIKYLDSARSRGSFRAKVAFALGQIAKSRPGSVHANKAVLALVRALSDSLIRSAVREALRNAGSAAVPALISHLDGNIPGDPSSAIELLRDIGDPRATPALVNELRRGRVEQSIILDALSKSGDDRALIPVMGLLKDPDPAVRLSALRALEPMLADDARAATVVAELLSDKDAEIRYLATRHLGSMKAKLAVEPLISVVKEDKEVRVRSAALIALGRIQDARASKLMLDLLSEPSGTLRRPAATALIYLEDPKSLPPLVRVIEKSTGRTRLEALRALAGVVRTHGLGSIRDLSLRKLAEDGPIRSAQAVIDIYGALPGREARRDLLSRLAKSADLRRRRSAIRALGSARVRDAANVVAGALGSRDTPTVAAACWALGKIGGPKNVDALLRLARTANPAIATNATAALALLAADKGAIKWAGKIERLLGHRSRLVRANALIALDRAGAQPSKKRLMTILAHDPSWLVRLAAVRSMRNSKANPEALKTVAREDPEQRVREAAAKAKERYRYPPRTEWRSFHVVDPARDFAAVTSEPYTTVGSDGLAVVLHSDLRGDAVEEQFPAGPHVAVPLSRVTDL